jgi:hypothetical protein
MNKASCLSPLSNVVLIWNAVHMSRITGQPRAAAHLVGDEDLARVSPLAQAHTIPSGTYFQSPRRRADIAPNLSWPDQRRPSMPLPERVNWQPIGQIPLVASHAPDRMSSTTPPLTGSSASLASNRSSSMFMPSNSGAGGTKVRPLHNGGIGPPGRAEPPLAPCHH